MRRYGVAFLSSLVGNLQQLALLPWADTFEAPPLVSWCMAGGNAGALAGALLGLAQVASTTTITPKIRSKDTMIQLADALDGTLVVDRSVIRASTRGG